MRYNSLFSLPLIAILAIGGSSPSLPTIARGSATPSVDELDAITGRIDTTITLGDWLKAHPGEVASDFIPYDPEIEEICRTVGARTTVGGRAATRWAVFTVPRPTPDETLPDDGPDVADRVCHLRAIWVSVEEADSAGARAFAGKLAQLIDAKLGRGILRTKMGGPGHARWKEPRKWSGPGTTVVLGISHQENREIAADEGAVDTQKIWPQSVSVIAYAPYGGLDDIGGPDYERANAYLDEEEGWEKKWYFDHADSAIARVTIPSIAADLRIVTQHMRTSPFLNAPSPASAALVRAAAAIHDRAPGLEPAQRAALLLAGDLVLQSAASAFDSGSDTTNAYYRLYKSLVAAGVEYGGEAYMVGFPYGRKWLWDAYGLDSLGTAGHAAMIELLATGWRTAKGCSDKEDEMTLIIQHGEAAMRRGDIDPLIQYYVGIAYQDIYSLARGHYYDGEAYTAGYEAKADEARVRGIERLRTSLLSLKERHLRRDAWRTAVRLMLNKTTQPRYFCWVD